MGVQTAILLKQALISSAMVSIQRTSNLCLLCASGSETSIVPGTLTRFARQQDVRAGRCTGRCTVAG